MNDLVGVNRAGGMPATQDAAVSQIRAMQDAVIDGEVAATERILHVTDSLAARCKAEDWNVANVECGVLKRMIEFRWDADNPRREQGTNRHTSRVSDGNSRIAAPSTESKIHDAYEDATEEDIVEVARQARETQKPPTRADVRRVVEERTTPHVTHNSGNNEWYTPAYIIDAARATMGGIDLDPASTPTANARVGATDIWTIEDDGLAQPWHGRVWMNPPYSKDLMNSFVGKLIEEVASGRVDQAVVITNNATETEWGRQLLSAANAVCFTYRRVRFLEPSGEERDTPLQGQMIIGLRVDVDTFIDQFKGIGSTSAWQTYI